MSELFSVHAIVPFITLCALELVLGIDNIIFISILAGRLPLAKQQRARTTGLLLAIFTRVGLLLSLSWLVSLTAPIFTVWERSFSGRDLILLIGGLFLIAKSTHEIHQKLEQSAEADASPGAVKRPTNQFASVIVQILLLDIVFSLDSVITAVGMVNELPIMIAAVISSTLVMIFLAGPLSRFIDKNPTLKILALSFLLMIGLTLIAEGLGQHISKGYIYFAMGFSLAVEMLNLKLLKPKKARASKKLSKT